MHQIKELLGFIDHGSTRSLQRRGESLQDYLEEKSKSPDPIAFDARRLIENGWTADKEEHFQIQARKCGVLIENGEELVGALAQAAVDVTNDRLAMEEKRRQVQALADPVGPQLPVDEKIA